MDGIKKKTGKKLHPQKSKILDNALLHETSRHVAVNLLAPAVETRKHVVVAQDKPTEIKKEALMPAKKDKNPPGHIAPDNRKNIRRDSRRIGPDNAEQVDVFSIISDLEKQLDAAFGLKDIQEKEIQDLKESLATADKKIGELEAELEETKGELVEQRKIELELESFENEQFEMLSEKRLLKEEITAGSAVKNDLENKIAALTKESETWNTRIAQMEQEISSSNAMIQNLRHQIFVLDDEKDVLSSKIEAMEAELSSVTTERDRSKKELIQAKESLDEIRLTLVDTRTRARGRYYKNKPK
jgi:chromosome segregation ATPase